MKVFSNVNFVLNPPEYYKNQYEVAIDQAYGGGTPSMDTFVLNPQIYFRARRDSGNNLKCWLTYKIFEGEETYVKVFVVKADGPERVSMITTDNQVAEDDTPYYGGRYSNHFVLNRDEEYIAIVSTFQNEDPISGVFEIKANTPLTYKLIKPL
uniref:Uncharacterized protein n=1 Tax=Euplotes harpa TaxID=151035 RepID=A0A7S3N9X6_9SPIT|mmetsp:Transcript_2838/g.3489  ORF Transcript_2838/g.3489 Transcript_2838/m.3489 type:complete len:153 (+) Transcript_2838:231-689(+)